VTQPAAPQLVRATDIFQPPGTTMWRKGETAATAPIAATSSGARPSAKPRRTNARGPRATSGAASSIASSKSGRVSRYGEGRVDHLPALAAELVAEHPDVIVAGAGPSPALAVRRATTEIPVVFTLLADPIALGLVNSFPHPGGQFTGVTALDLAGFPGKHLQLLTELVPKASRIAYFINPNNAIHVQIARDYVPGAAQSLGIEVFTVEARSRDDIDVAFAAATAQGAQAIDLPGDPLFSVNLSLIIESAARHRLPTLYLLREFVVPGGLMAYGPRFDTIWRRAGWYVDQILRGARPADLPVEQPTRYHLIVNMKTAASLGVTIPPSILARADELIE
jgi:putative tryptophan/tyrosine transport system substrate-binding protein